METLYSRIIWEELGRRDIKINEEPFEKIEELILDWFKSAPKERIQEVLKELSWFDRITFEDWYDGAFYGINQREKEKQYKNEKGNIDPDIVVHDSGIMPSVLYLLIKTNISPEELEFYAKILRIYRNRMRDEKPNESKPKKYINEMVQGEEIV